MVRGRTVLLEVVLAFRMCSPWHQYPYSSYSFLYIPFGTDKENLFKKQSFLGRRSFPLFSWPWPLNPKSDKHLISPFSINPKSHKKVIRKKEIITIQTSFWLSDKSFVKLLNPLTPQSDWHLISPYHITPESYIKVMIIKEVLTN